MWKRFTYTISKAKEEPNTIIKVMDSFMKYLGFEDFGKSDISIHRGFVSTEVCFDDRRVFISVDEKNIGRYVITDKNGEVLDVIAFKIENDEWVEVKNLA